MYDAARSSAHAAYVRAVHITSQGGKRGGYGNVARADNTCQIRKRISRCTEPLLRGCPACPTPHTAAPPTPSRGASIKRFRSAVPFSSRPPKGVHTSVSRRQHLFTSSRPELKKCPIQMLPKSDRSDPRLMIYILRGRYILDLRLYTCIRPARSGSCCQRGICVTRLLGKCLPGGV